MRQRLLSYLSEQALENGTPHFTIPFNRQQLANYLAVNRSSMSKELSRMQEEEFLTYHKNRFTLKGPCLYE
ncbi:helix-turn-helix domain-containing protein [uncultured Levyella sp.]|uniref:helix-turn-helix domain-containing protein n=1 Tax=uncultured Levyella sp. TaxID=1715800 RepID=UPI0025886650|nr:helix-turn-helix domain-containing protein [uncultured Levyella sp.]